MMAGYTHCLHCGDLLADHNWCRNCGPIEDLDEYNNAMASTVNDLLDWIIKNEEHHMPIQDFTVIRRAFRLMGREVPFKFK